ncbi:S1 family peptidase [Lentzea sp. JNUCC 0626]|uniref:S1 family peptidase n=1 Tax=Lentzea sp. JNUCC 0626 TaxID=3367513 RepID=UPI003749052F
MKTRSLLAGVAAVAAVLSCLTAPAVAKTAPTDVQSMIVNGRPASQVYSFMVSTNISVGGGHYCGGALIKPNWVVSARHCGNPVQVRVGTTNSNSGGTVARVRRTIHHPGNGVDVSLIELATSVPQTPIQIAATSGPAGTATRIIGWGQTSPVPGNGRTTQLMELDTSIVPDNRCPVGRNPATDLCTNNPDGNAGACYGDSGGPQIKRVNGIWQLVGATSGSGNGNELCATGPSLYMDVPAVSSWIRSYTG